MNLKNDSILLRPFASMNYAYVNTSTGMNINEYIFSGGLHFSYRYERLQK
jgi:hypothetical protein